jgi:hypothetical protein
MKNYKVTAECVVHIPTSTSGVPTLGTLYRGATFLGDPDSEKVKFLLACDPPMIVELGDNGQPAKPEAAADAKLSIRSSKDELTAAAVGKGMAEADAKAMGKPDLLAWLEAPAPTP